jgi:hypothetical protein
MPARIVVTEFVSIDGVMEAPERRNLRLTESKVVGDGVLVLTYERAT